MKQLCGIYSALITPMDKSEEVNIDVLKKLVAWELTQGIEGFYCCGSSGEALLLSKEERKLIVETIVESSAGKVPVIAHVGALRTADTVCLARHATDCGASAVSMIPPYYYKFTQEEILGYYKDVIDQAKVPVIIYNIPQFTGISFTKDNAGSLLENDLVIGVKHTSTDLYGLERMRNSFPDKIYFNGFDEIFLSAMAAGADSAIGTTVNLFAPWFLGIRQLFLEGKMSAALVEQEKVNNCVELFVKYGIFNGVKYALSMNGLEYGQCRAPFRPLEDHAKLIIMNLVREYTISKK